MKTFICSLLSTLLIGQACTQTPKVMNVAIFVHEGVELLDFAGPGEVFSAAGRDFNVYAVASSKKVITSQRFLSITPQYSFEDAPKPDVIILPGGATQIPMNDPKVIEWLQKEGKSATYLLSVCTGALLLAKAGFLDNKTATTHYCCQDNLSSMFPKVTVVKGKRWVDNGNIITTEGISSGIDGSLYLVSKIKGKAAADRIAEYMMYKWDLEKLDYMIVK